MTTTTTITPSAMERLQDAIRFSCGGYATADARAEAIARGIAKANTAVAEGQWIIEDGTGVGLFNPTYHQSGFRPLRWMTKEGIATMRNLTTRVKVGDTFTREISFHPRHGITTRSARRLA
jgi:hypothetical protein